MTARARDMAPLSGRLGDLQQPRESRRPGLMQGGAEANFHRLQVHAIGPLPFGENATQQSGYFVRDLRVDRRGRFFSSGVSVSPTGRRAQIFSLTSMISPQSA